MKYDTFSFSVKGETTFGVDCLNQLPEIVSDKQCKQVFLVADPAFENNNIVKNIKKMLKKKDIDCVTFTDVEHPTSETVGKGVKLFSENDIDCIVGLGGGSAMDTAKGVALVGNSDKKIDDYAKYAAGVNPVVEHSVPPLIAIPTTAGTGSEVTRNAVITDRNDYKMIIINDKILPENVLLDPKLLKTLPDSVAASAGMDALIHAVEAYLSLLSSPFTDTMAEKAMELIGENIRPFVANRKDLEAASGMHLGSMFAGIALSLAFPGNTHAMSHPLSGHFGIPHGVSNSVLFPVILEFNALADKGKYKKIYNYIKPENPVGADFDPMILVNEVKKLNKDLGLPANLSELGVTEDSIPELVEDALMSTLYDINPRQTTEEDIKQLYWNTL